MATTTASTGHEKKVLEICSADIADFNNSELLELTKIPGLRVDATDENGMTGLMHAAYKGNTEACNTLLENGADVNSNFQSDGVQNNLGLIPILNRLGNEAIHNYTPLMFATIAGHANTVELLLQAGAKTNTVNNAGKTAVQLGAFVGQHACVRTINNFFSVDDLQYYTKPHGLEKVPKLDPSLVSPLYPLITTSNLHPVKIILHLRSNPSLLDLHDQVTRVLRTIGDQMMKEEREGYSLKLYYITFILQQCHKTEGGTSGCLKMLLTFQENGVAAKLDNFMRQCLREFPHTHSSLLQQMVATLAKVSPGSHPTTLGMFHSAILRNRSEENLESCSTCGEFSSSLKNCSKCRQAKYCGVECQKLAWTVGNHKKLCKKWTLKQAERHPQSPGHLKENTPAGDQEGHLKEKSSSLATTAGDHQLREDCSSEVGASI